MSAKQPPAKKSKTAAPRAPARRAAPAVRLTPQQLRDRSVEVLDAIAGGNLNVDVDLSQIGDDAVLHAILNVIDYGMTVQEAVDAPRFHQQWLPDLTYVEPFAISPDTRKILEDKGHKLGNPQPANHVAAILVGAPALEGKPVGANRFYGANDPRRNTGLALGY